MSAHLVGPTVENDQVNKFDPDSVASMLALDDAMTRHPDPADGPLHRFSVWVQPQVMVDARMGCALAYTRSYGLVRFTDSNGSTSLNWYPASDIRRVIPFTS